MRRDKSFLALLLLPFVHSFGIPEVHSILDSTSSSLHIAAASNTNLNLFDQYQTALHDHPLNTQVTTGVTLAILGDAIAQFSARRDPYNVKRAASFAAFDGVYRVAQHFLYPPMILACQGNVLKNLWMEQSLAAATEQALVSQLLIIPLVYYPCFFALTGVVQGLTVSETIQRAKESFWPLMKRNWLYWIPVQASVFAFVHDESLQISILIACGLVWTVILSVVAGAASTEEPSLELPEEAMKQITEPLLQTQVSVLMDEPVYEQMAVNATRS